MGLSNPLSCYFHAIFTLFLRFCFRVPFEDRSAIYAALSISHRASRRMKTEEPADVRFSNEPHSWETTPSATGARAPKEEKDTP